MKCRQRLGTYSEHELPETKAGERVPDNFKNAGGKNKHANERAPETDPSNTDEQDLARMYTWMCGTRTQLRLSFSNQHPLESKAGSIAMFPGQVMIVQGRQTLMCKQLKADFNSPLKIVIQIRKLVV